MQTRSYKRGLIGTIALILIAVGLLAYFKVDIRSLGSRPEVKKTISFVVENSKIVWNVYIKKEVAAVGKFISDHHITEKTIAYSLKAWEKIKAVGESLRHIR